MMGGVFRDLSKGQTSISSQEPLHIKASSLVSSNFIIHVTGTRDLRLHLGVKLADLKVTQPALKLASGRASTSV